MGQASRLYRNALLCCCWPECPLDAIALFRIAVSNPCRHKHRVSCTHRNPTRTPADEAIPKHTSAAGENRGAMQTCPKLSLLGRTRLSSPVSKSKSPILVHFNHISPFEVADEPNVQQIPTSSSWGCNAEADDFNPLAWPNCGSTWSTTDEHWLD